MDTDCIVEIIIILVLILLSAFFSSAETALTTVNRIRMKNLADEGNKKAAKVIKITDDTAKLLSAILIGNNIVNIVASALTTTVAMKLFNSVGVSVATGLLTLIILIFAEITPKTIASIKAEKMSLSYSGPIYALIKVLTPLIFIVNVISSGVLKLFGVSKEDAVTQMTENELRSIVEVGKDDGVIEHEEFEIIDNLFEFGEAQAKDIMVPRIDMTFVNVGNTFAEILEIFKDNMYTRYPVYEESTDNVIGFINVKDMLCCEDRENFNVRSILREAFFTHEHKNTSELFFEMRDSSINTAIVLDEYGMTAGLITLEDLLEEIVGEIRDEYDDDERDDIEEVEENIFILDGNTKLDDVNEELNINLTSEDYESIAGFILEKLDRLPVEGEQVIIKNDFFDDEDEDDKDLDNSEDEEDDDPKNWKNRIVFTVEKMDNKRIATVKAEKIYEI